MKQFHHRATNKENQAINNAESLTILLGGKWENNNGLACCPAHDDRTPSLSISDGEKRIVFRCHAGCAQEKVREKLRELGVDLSLVQNSRRAPKVVHLKTYKINREVLSNIRSEKWSPAEGTIVETYLNTRGLRTPENLYYTKDNYGRPQMLAVMYSSSNGETVGWQTTTLKNDGSKSGNDSRRFLKGTKTSGAYTPFGDEESSTMLCIAEGIETALSVHRFVGLPVWAAYSATNLPKLVIPSRYREVIITADNDESGVSLKNAEKLATKLTGQGRIVRIAMPRTEGWDWNDVLQKYGATKGQRKRILNAEIIEGEPIEELFMYDLRNVQLPERKALIGHWLTESSLTMVHAKTGIGKTFFAMGIAYAIANGDEFLGWEAPEPRTVLYLDGEMPAQLMQKRMGWFETVYQSTENIMVESLSYRAKIGKPRLNLCNEDDRKRIDQAIERTHGSVLILDNLSCLAPGAESEGEIWEPLNDWLISLRDRGLAVVLVHHDGKDAARGQRGQVRKLDQFDNDIQLRRPPGYEQSDGCEFVFHFGDKARDVHGDEACSFTAKMDILDEVMEWTRSGDPDTARAAKEKEGEGMWTLYQKGSTTREIADRFGVSEGNVSKKMKRYHGGNLRSKSTSHARKDR